MKKASEYRQHAVECRALMTSMTDDAHREQLQKMALIWERMADEREREARAGGDPSFDPSSRPKVPWP